ncbi:MAG: sulfatase [Planctomycetes bacterium]|nr:sulfatase [Planctomycetota bacterium]
MNRILSIVFGAGFGALTGAALFTAVFPPLAGVMIAEQIFLAALGSGMVALPLGLLVALATNREPQGSWLRDLSGFALGFWVASIPSFGVKMANDSEEHRWSVISIGLAFFALALTWRFGQAVTRPIVIRMLSGTGVIAGVIAFLLGPGQYWFGWVEMPPVPETFPATSAISAESAPPDVLLVSIDTLRADAVVGHNAADVPVMDALRERGIWAEWARSSSNCTVPGHTGMMFGMGTLEHRVTSVYQTVPAEPVAVAELFRDNGYATVAIVSNGVMMGGTGFERGFHAYDDSVMKQRTNASVLLQGSEARTFVGRLLPRKYYRRLIYSGVFAAPGGNSLVKPEKAEGGETTARAMDWFETLYAQEDPFFFFLHYIDPHGPYRAPEGWRGRHSTPDTPARSKERYLEEVEFSDYCLGQVLDRMDASGRPYVVLITSDHGEHLGEHGLWGHTNSAYEELIRVPFILAGPGIPAKRIDEPHLADVAPTLLAAAGIQAPQEMTGFSVLSEVPSNRVHFARERKAVGIKQGTRKWSAYQPLGLLDPSELVEYGEGFLLDRDPGENNSLEVHEMPEGWLELMLDTFAAAPPPILERVTDLQVRADRWAQLQQMGYIDPRDEVKQAQEGKGDNN